MGKHTVSVVRLKCDSDGENQIKKERKVTSCDNNHDLQG